MMLNVETMWCLCLPPICFTMYPGQGKSLELGVGLELELGQRFQFLIRDPLRCLAGAVLNKQHYDLS